MKQTLLTNAEIGDLCMALSHLLKAGIPAGDALMLLRADEQDPVFGDMLLEMAEELDAGSSLAEVFRKTERFPGYLCALLEVGQRSGKTESTLDALARYYYDREEQARQLRSALLYPTALFGVLLAVVLALLIWVLPIFDRVYARLGSHLTGVAGGLLKLGILLKQALPVLLVLLAAVGILAAIPVVRRAVTAFLRKKLGDRGAFGKRNAARFLQALSLGMGSGMLPEEAAALAASLAEMPHFQKQCGECLEQLRRGEVLSRALRGSGLLPVAQCRLLEAGERSGCQERVLENIAQRLLKESEEQMQRQLGRLEPGVVAVACVLIGLVLLAVMLPLTDIMSAIG